jgi:hypothetical protein
MEVLKNLHRHLFSQCNRIGHVKILKVEADQIEPLSPKITPEIGI